MRDGDCAALSREKLRVAILKRRKMPEKRTFFSLINNRLVSPSLVGPPAMNYGQLRRWKDYNCVEYSYAIRTADFIDIGSPWFDRLRAELKADISHAANLDAPEQTLIKLGYPDLAQVLDENSRLAAKLFLALPLELNKLFAPKDSSGIRYAVNSVDWFSTLGAVVEFGGLAFDMESQAKRREA